MPGTRNQEYAQRAFHRVQDGNLATNEKYASFAKSFPALLHSCGLCQAVAFADAKKHADLLDDLVAVLADDAARDRYDLATKAREADVTKYLHLSRDVLSASVWIKRYVEALEE